MKKTILIIVLAALCLNFRAQAQNNTRPPNRNIIGKVIDEQGNPLTGATVKVKDGNNGVITDKDGNFNISHSGIKVLLLVSFVGYQTVEVPYDTNQPQQLIISLKADANSLNEVQVIGYGTTTKKLNTGSVSTITSAEIEKEPVTNVLSALSGRMPGVYVQTTNGLPGGNINIQIRGDGSIAAGTNPLYIIDGVPFESSIISPGSVISLGNLAGAVSPLNSINPTDIESITVLKDADATSIYGSRGTNGVVLITTKKGKSGQTKANINFSSGFNESANFPQLLGIDDYLKIRKEAFANDGLTPSSDPTSAGYAPDLTVWSQTQNTNWAKYLFGNKASFNDLQANMNGGNELTTFSTSANFHQEGNVISKSAEYTRGGIHFNLRHLSSDKKFELQLTNSLTLDNNSSPTLQDASSPLLLPPNFPLTDGNGQLYWGGVNPLAEMNATSNTKTDYIVTNLILRYNITNDLKITVSSGYNKINIDQVQLFPLSSLYPGSVNYAQYGENSNQSFITEPQLNYFKKIGKSEITFLLGATYQDEVTQSQFLEGSNYSNEGLMNNIASAASIDSRSNNYTNYKYLSAFSRLTYNLMGKYVLNATIRRDGSSRFGEGNRFGNFGSIGGAWIFSEEKWLKARFPALSFGKLRASYGTTGNDQIPDYQYLSTYGSQGRTYQGTATLTPTRIENADFHWETTRKMDLGAELGFFDNRLLLNADYYRNRSDDQLVQYALPSITGFASYQANLPAVVQNTGLEFELTTVNIKNSQFNWTTSFNITLPKNKLVSFENFASSSYAQTLQIGYDITRISGLKFLGVDPKTGIPEYADQNGQPSDNPYFYNTIGKQTPDFYGGISNTISYKNFTLDILFQFARQMSLGGVAYTPGVESNIYAYMLNVWQKPGDITNIPKASTISDFYYPYSSANYFTATYARLKNLSLSYSLPERFAKRIKAERVSVYLRGQNILTFWNNRNALIDPESGTESAQSTLNIPPGKTFVAGVDITF